MTRYLSIQPQGDLADLGVDASGRAQCVFTVVAWSRPSPGFLQELMAVLIDAGVGVENVSIFASSSVVIPSGPGPYISIRTVAGPGPVGTHNAGAGAYRRPSAQLVARAGTWVAAEAMARAAYDALIAVRNQEVAS